MPSEGGVVVLVLERDVERRSRGAALLGRGSGAPCPRSASRTLFAEAKVVDYGRAVLDVAVRDRRAAPLPTPSAGACRAARARVGSTARRAARSRRCDQRARDRRRSARRRGFATTAPAATIRVAGSTGSPPSRTTSSTIVTTFRNRRAGHGASISRPWGADNRPVPTLYDVLRRVARRSTARAG